MNVLTLYEPWASFVVRGIKLRETRSWTTAYRGPLLIHASKSLPGDVVDSFRYSEPHRAIFARSGLTWDLVRHNRGRILGAVWLDHDTPTQYLSICPDRDDIDETRFDIGRRDGLLGNYIGNRFAWFFEQPHEFEEQPQVRGRRRLWEFPKLDWPAAWKDEPFLVALERMETQTS